jgi:hypothetical protein
MKPRTFFMIITTITQKELKETQKLDNDECHEDFVVSLDEFLDDFHLSMRRTVVRLGDNK